ncbi:MAG: acetate kinase [Bacilli bacterium]|jgi:acetate kinase|nr:acetate kinase [Bacilli bacterium]
MKILSVNCGSSSLKFQAYEMPEEKVLIQGLFERIGIDGSCYTITINGEKTTKEVDLPDHQVAVDYLTKELLENKVVSSLDEIEGVGHRVVAGGDQFDRTTVINDEVLQEIDALSKLAPLHNPAAVIGIKAFQKAIPNAIATAVFDTAFHQTMPKENYLYPVPMNWYTEYAVRRYGAHGTSHQYISERVNEILGRKDTKVITCHVGNGGSISAVLNGKCINTSMGFTPNAGIMMGSRSGDIDVTLATYMMEQTGMSPKEIDHALNKESGLLAVSGISSDARDIEAGINEGNENCKLAQKMYVNRIRDYIAKYYVELGGCDAIVFTAGLGENSILTRKQIMNALAPLGVVLDEKANEIRGVEALVSAKDSSIPCYVIPTDEEVMIARDTYALAK